MAAGRGRGRRRGKLPLERGFGQSDLDRGSRSCVVRVEDGVVGDYRRLGPGTRTATTVHVDVGAPMLRLRGYGVSRCVCGIY